MSNIVKKTLSQYINDSIKLAKSMHIYLDVLKIHSRIMTYKIYGLNIDDVDNKYILNMAGELFKYDKPLNINVNNQFFSYNKELIKTNEYVKENMLKFDLFYDTVINNNRTMATYIKGCLTDLTVDDILNSKNGQILWYNENLLDNKIIISNIQKFIYDFLDIYNNKDYVIDELYAPGLVSNLYSVLPMVILVEKLNLVLTSEVDDFHLYNFFKSYKALDNEIDVLNKETLIWLYGNINYLKKHIGKNNILDIISNKIMDKLGVGLGKTIVEKNKPIINTDITNIKDIYYTKDINVKYEKINNSFTLNTKKIDKIDDVINNEYKQNYINDEDTVNIEINNLNNKINYNKYTKELSKVLTVDDFILINLKDTNIFAYFLNALIYQANNVNNNYYISFLNPLDGVNYSLNSKQVLGLMLYLMVNIFTGRTDIVINNINYLNVLDITAAKNFNIDDYNLNTDEKALINEILEDLQHLPNEITTLESFKSYINISYNILYKFWYYLSNTNDIIYSNNLLHILNMLFTSGKLENFENIAVDEYLESVNCPIKNITKDESLILFNNLINSITGNALYETQKLKMMLDKVISIGKKLTSYTIQFLYSTDFSYIVTGQYQTLKNTLGKKTYLTINKAKFYFYEKVDKELNNLFIPLIDGSKYNNVIKYRLYNSYKLKLQTLLDKDMIYSGTNIVYINKNNRLPNKYKPMNNSRYIINDYDINQTEINTFNIKKVVKPIIKFRNEINEIEASINNNENIISKYRPDTSYNKIIDNNIRKSNIDNYLIKKSEKIFIRNKNEISNVDIKIGKINTIPKQSSPEIKLINREETYGKENIEQSKIRVIDEPKISVKDSDNLNTIPVIKIKR